MTRQMQRIILIVAVVVSGLTYVLLNWGPAARQPAEPQGLEPSMVLKTGEAAANAPGFKPGAFLLLSLEQGTDDDITRLQDAVMGGLREASRQTFALQLALDGDGDGWQRQTRADFPGIVRFVPPRGLRAEILRGLRVCFQGDGLCVHTGRPGSRYLYLLDGDDFSVLYLGDIRWGVDAIASDIRRVVAARTQ